MVIDTQTDMHVHTSRCNHAVGTMEQYVQEAIRKGLKRMVFLEHLEEEISYSYRTWLTEEDFDDYFAEGETLQKRYHDEIEILLGVEVGYNPECPQRLLTRIAADPGIGSASPITFFEYQAPLTTSTCSPAAGRASMPLPATAQQRY
jgi:histidinol-phosphatase (PHP family)